MARLTVIAGLLVAAYASSVASALQANGAATTIHHMRTVYNKQTKTLRREKFTSTATDADLDKVRAAKPSSPSAAAGNGNVNTPIVSYKFPALSEYEDAVVTGSFADTMGTIGWNVLDIESSNAFSDEEQAYEAGHLEGSLTALQIHQHMFNRYNNDPVPQNVLDFLTEQDKWVQTQIRDHGATDKFWGAAKLLRRQLQGIFDGANAANVTGYAPMTFQNYMTVVAMGDIFDLVPALNPSMTERPENNWRKMSREAFEEWFTINGHCSAAVTVSADYSDLFFGHSSWYVYTATLRVFKRLNLNYKTTAAHRVSFSSYPGMLSSFDDFLVTDRNIVAIETSLSVFNTSVYKGNIKPASALYWMRNMVANYMSTTAAEWGIYFSQHHSGTYNNQWMALDLNLFTPKQDLKPNTLWITEEMPGLIKSRDVTSILSYGYFPSYNVPLDEEIYAKLGYPEAVATQGPIMTDYHLCVRAQIFRRDAAKVQTMAEFQHLLQYNDYQHDPLSEGNPYYAIASRVDLSPTPKCFGAIDSKTSSWSQWMHNGQTILAFSGPTPQQARFSFDTTKATCGKHVGLPTAYTFNFMNMSTAHATPVPQN